LARAATSSEQVIETIQSLAGRTILLAPDDRQAGLAAGLSHHGARVITWPALEFVAPESFATLDGAIENLFGYDWLIFRGVNAIDFFLRRLHQLGHETSELDALRICALHDSTQQQLEEMQVHVDLVSAKLATEGVMATLEKYIGRDALRGLNFLLPRAAISRDHLPQGLEEAGARVDVVEAYRTVSNNSELVQLGVLLENGGIDCIAFTSPSSIKAFSQVFDTNDLSRLLREVAVACVDEATAQAATAFGLCVEIMPTDATISELARAIVSCFFTSNAQHP
jgi:uroporphyrinogen III methyltransferase/synthase